MKSLLNVVTVDPGWNTGLAYWAGDNTPIVSIIKEPPRRKKIRIEVPRLNFMFEKFEAYIYPKLPLDLVVIEGVEMWMGSTKSMTAAARGNLFALAYLVGGYTSICSKMGVTVKYVYARGDKKQNKEPWKGQMSADVLEKRIYKINKTIYKEHIREAVGIGFHCMGIL